MLKVNALPTMARLIIAAIGDKFYNIKLCKVWPDVGVKISPTFPKSCPNILLESDICQNSKKFGNFCKIISHKDL